MSQRSVKVPARAPRIRSNTVSAVASPPKTRTREVSRRRPPVEPAESNVQRPAPHADTDPITVTTERVITGATAVRLCTMQLENFEPLAKLAVQRQTRSFDEMMDICADADFVKVVAWQGGRPVGFGVLTNVLAKVPEVSADFFVERYPEQAARNAVYFGIYVTVDEPLRGLTVFWRVSTAMWQVSARDSGVLAFDVCDFNRTLFGAEEVAKQLAAPFPGSKVSVVDRQTWFVAELPEPIAGV